MIVPVMCGCREQKYANWPALANVNEKRSPVSRTLERNEKFFATTVCGISSSFTQVTVVPGRTARVCWAKVKLPIRTTAVWGGGPAFASTVTADRANAA